MTTEVRERKFEEAIEAALIGNGEATPRTIEEKPRSATAATAVDALGSYHKRLSAQYDVDLCLIPGDVMDFITATQPKTWQQFRQHYGDDAREKLLKRISREVERRGVIEVLRGGIKESGCHFDLAYFQPASGLNPETQRLYAANIFGVVRQLYYSKDGEQSVDLALFLNGLPIFTAELKNPLNGQNVLDAIRQYKECRLPSEPLFSFRRCMAHFAVDPDLVYTTTRLQGAATEFLPFNKGKNGGAGNPSPPPVRDRRNSGAYAISYLWEQIWHPDSVLNLVSRFVHQFEEEELDSAGRKRKKQRLIFPRYHQLDCVRRLIAHARDHGPGEHYLIQHSAGSGKSNSIAWLAHQLSTLHDAQDTRVFDSIVIVTDRKVLDRQLQTTVRQFEQTLGVVENIDQSGAQLKEALEKGKTIIVSTLQKYPVIARDIGALPGKRFALIIDEAHSSQSGETAKDLKKVLSAGATPQSGAVSPGNTDQALIAAAAEEEHEPETLEDKIAAEIKARGRLPNVSTFAFTATPKPKTLELFGTKRPDGKFEPFSLYSMRQAIEEKFILDVLQNYTTHKIYWKLLKKIEDDPRYDRDKANYLLRQFVDLHEHSIREKVRIMIEHFASHAAHRIDGKAKAMIVTRSRLHAVRYRLAVDQYLKEKKHPWKALVAFSGTVRDPETGAEYTEANMNGFSEAQTAKTFAQPDYRLLIVAEKFQTGFDQPLLHTMYVDKKLSGVNAVQTLSRLNRVHPGKEETMVLDFANDSDEIIAAFKPYYEATLLSEATDPNLLYDLQQALSGFGVFSKIDIDEFAKRYFGSETQDRLYAVLKPLVERFEELEAEEQNNFRSRLTDYVRLYAFLSQVLTFADAELEKLYQLSRFLRRYLPRPVTELPREIQEQIEIESFRVQRTSSGQIHLPRGVGILEPIQEKAPTGKEEEHVDVLSEIIRRLNERFGANLTEEDRVTLRHVAQRLEEDNALDASARVNTRENVRLTFEHKFNDIFQEIINSNFDLYRRATDDENFGTALKDYLFDQYLRRHREVKELIGRGESKTLEFKSTLRWNMQENRKDAVQVTHAVLKTIAAFLNTEGGDLIIGVNDAGDIVGIEQDQFDSNDAFMRHLAQMVRNGLGDRASTCIDPRVQKLNGKSVCLVACQRSPEPVFLKWKGVIADPPEGDFYVRSGPGTVKLGPDSVREFIKTRFGRQK
jgi:type I restriction enzyme R subunit